MRHLIDRVLELQDDEQETDGTVTKKRLQQTMLNYTNF